MGSGGEKEGLGGLDPTKILKTFLSMEISNEIFFNNTKISALAPKII